MIAEIADEATYMRSINEQLMELRDAKGVKKKDIASSLGVSDSHFSHWLTKPMDMDRMEQIAGVARVDPTYFDEYVAQSLYSLAHEDEGFIVIMRSYIAASEARKRKFKRAALEALTQ